MRPDARSSQVRKSPALARQLEEALIASLTDHDRDRARTSRWDRRAHRVSETIYQGIYAREVVPTVVDFEGGPPPRVLP